MFVKRITIAIDGYSSCGKSTLAKDLARELEYTYIDSGAMYRAVTWYAIENDFFEEDTLDFKGLINDLDNIQIDFAHNSETGISETYVNGRNIESEIRIPRISSKVSAIASIKEVRVKLVDLQRRLGQDGGIVMDGRDIGSVVFPDAEMKFFMTASIEVRAQRRWKELAAKGKKLELEEVQTMLIRRDLIDSTRDESPLIQPEDAIVIDNSEINKEEQLDMILEHVKEAASTPV